MSEYNEGDGPIVWILLIPTMEVIMEKFLKGELTETQLLENTQPGEKYDSIYLCSASVLEEYRRKGLAKKLTVDAVREISKEHKIKSLFYWPFSPAGQSLAESIAKEVNLPLYKR
jgi:predicted acetyltransferase